MIKKIEGAIRKRLFAATGISSEFAEMIIQLKNKFCSVTDRRDRIHILTVLPKSWTITKVMDVFGTTYYMARLDKKTCGSYNKKDKENRCGSKGVLLPKVGKISF